MKQLSLQEELQANVYPGRGIVIGKTPDGTMLGTYPPILYRRCSQREAV